MGINIEALQATRDRMVKLYKEANTYEDGYGISIGPLKDYIEDIDKILATALAPKMTTERAFEIVKAINARCFVTMGIKEDLPPLDDVSLGDMLEAKTLVDHANKAAEAHQREHGGGSRSVHMVPDDRLIAVAYAIDHYPSDPQEAILALPISKTHRKVLVVLNIERKQLEADDEE